METSLPLPPDCDDRRPASPCQALNSFLTQMLLLGSRDEGTDALERREGGAGMGPACEVHQHPVSLRTWAAQEVRKSLGIKEKDTKPG